MSYATYTAEDVEAQASRCQYVFNNEFPAHMLRDYATLLRERESAKAAVTDEVIQLAIVTAEKYSNATQIGWDTMRAALEAVAPMLASARVPDETGWLIESTFGASSPSWWTGIPEGCGQSFTTDANKAVRFCRKGDAEAVAKHMRRVIVTEHKWLAAAPKPETEE